MMKIVRITTWLLLACCLVGCNQSKDTLAIFVAGDTQGWITPCGCAANQSGGLARRATLVTSASSTADTLLLDVGGSAHGTSAYQQLKLESLLQGLHQMGLEAMNVGGPETEFSPEQLAKIEQSTRIKWLSSNLLTSDGKPFGLDSLSVRRAGLTIAIAGVVDPSLVKHEQWSAIEPVQGVLKAFADSKADVRVVLAYLEEDALRKLAESLPEVDYIIGGPTGQAISPTKVGPVTIMSSTNKGKFLASLKLKSEGERFQQLAAEIAEVKSGFAEDPTQLANLKAYYAKLAKEDFTVQEAGLVADMGDVKKGYAIAGSASCVQCHQQDDSVWHQSKHSHAWDVLVAKSAHFDPHCQQCHTTGYGLSGGFTNVAQSTTLVHVGCENCHGPSEAHVANPRQRTPFQAKEQCIRCHDHENSPAFQFDAYWAKVYHAGLKNAEPIGVE